MLSLRVFWLLLLFHVAWMLPVWLPIGNSYWREADTMDTAVFTSGSAVVVPMRFTYVSGGGLFTYVMPNSVPAYTKNIYIGHYACKQPGNPFALATDHAMAIKNHDRGHFITTNPDIKLIHILTIGNLVCISAFRYADYDDPCYVAMMYPNDANPSSSLRSISIGADYVSFTAPTENAVISLDLVTYSNVENLTVAINNVPSYRLAIPVQVNDVLRGIQLNGSCILIGGDGNLNIQRLDRKFTSFVCDETEIDYAIAFCVAPSMHLCKDLHYRAECKPSPNCHFGSYDRMWHECHCQNNYNGTYCDTLACVPPCQYGQCHTNNNTCSCWGTAFGDRCDKYYMNVTNDTYVGNLTIFNGAVIFVEYLNSSHARVFGTLFISNGTSIVVIIDRLPTAGDYIHLFTYESLVGIFDSVSVTVANGSPLPRCVGYRILYGISMTDILFYDTCSEQETVSIPWYVSVSIILTILVVLVTIILLGKFNERFHKFLLGVHARVLQSYRQMREPHSHADIPIPTDLDLDAPVPIPSRKRIPPGYHRVTDMVVVATLPDATDLHAIEPIETSHTNNTSASSATSADRTTDDATKTD